MVLTATAPPSVDCSLRKLVRNSVVSKDSIHRPNVFLQCKEIPVVEKDISYFTTEMIGSEPATIYMDFIDNVGPIMSKICEEGIESVAYYGEMDYKSQFEKWFWHGH